MHRREFGHSPAVPEGLAAILLAVLSGGGAPVIWDVQGSPRPCLEKLPSTISPRISQVRVPDRLSSAYGRWLTARQEAVALLLPDNSPSALLGFIAAPLTALGDRGLREALHRLLDASGRLYEDAAAAEGGGIAAGDPPTSIRRTSRREAGERWCSWVHYTHSGSVRRCLASKR